MKMNKEDTGRNHEICHMHLLEISRKKCDKWFVITPWILWHVTEKTFSNLNYNIIYWGFTDGRHFQIWTFMQDCHEGGWPPNPLSLLALLCMKANTLYHVDEDLDGLRPSVYPRVCLPCKRMASKSSLPLSFVLCMKANTLYHVDEDLDGLLKLVNHKVLNHKMNSSQTPLPLCYVVVGHCVLVS